MGGGAIIFHFCTVFHFLPCFSLNKNRIKGVLKGEFANFYLGLWRLEAIKMSDIVHLDTLVAPILLFDRDSELIANLLVGQHGHNNAFHSHIPCWRLCHPSSHSVSLATLKSVIIFSENLSEIIQGHWNHFCVLLIWGT